jgi:hypothetical protein
VILTWQKGLRHEFFTHSTASGPQTFARSFTFSRGSVCRLRKIKVSWLPQKKFLATQLNAVVSVFGQRKRL